jgi:hypothetical protein
MKTHELSAALLAFAQLVGGTRTEELRDFARIFQEGKAQTVAARLKQIPEGYGVSSSLKESLTAIEAGLTALGAKKQAAELKAVASKFSGHFDGSTAELAARIKVDTAKPAKVARKKTTDAVADEAQARHLADELTSLVLKTVAFSEVIKQLENAKEVSTPTLHMIGNRFLGNSKAYKGRKSVVKDIMKRQAEEVLDASRRVAVKRAG